MVPFLVYLTYTLKTSKTQRKSHTFIPALYIRKQYRAVLHLGMLLHLLRLLCYQLFINNKGANVP